MSPRGVWALGLYLLRSVGKTETKARKNQTSAVAIFYFVAQNDYLNQIILNDSSTAQKRSTEWVTLHKRAEFPHLRG